VHRDMDPSHVDELLPHPFPEDVHRLPTFSFVEKLSLRDDVKDFGEASIRYSATSRHSGVSTSYRLRGSDAHDMWPDAVLNGFLRSIPCLQIRVLCLNLGKIGQAFHADGWRCFFGRLTALKELYVVDMDVSNVIEGLISLRRDARDANALPGLTKVCLIRPQGLDIDTILSWSEDRMTHNRPIDHKLTVVSDDRRFSLGLEATRCLPDNVEIHSSGSTFEDHIEAFEEPFYMTCPPFGRDLS